MRKKELRALLAGMLNHLIDLDNDNERLTNEMLAWMKEARRLKKALEAAGYSVYGDAVVEKPKYCPKCNKLTDTVQYCRKCRKPTKTTADLSEHYHGCGTHARYVPKAYRKPNA